MIHCTVSDNLGTSISLHTSTLSLYNSIVWGVDLESVSLDESSDLSLDHTASSFVWAGTSVFQADPLFSTMGLWQELDDGSWVWQPGDYHLQSVFGRWNPENAQWETDVQTSPYVGAGDRVIWQEKGWSSGGNPSELWCLRWNSYGQSGGVVMASVYKNSPRLMFFCMLLLGLFSCQILAEEPVGFLDENLKAAIEESLWLDDPTPSDMLELNELICVNQGIADITGLEYATNLDVLNLRYNHIGDVSSLSRCTQLRVLNLSENKIISDLSPIAMLTGLEDLDCHANQITDLSFTAHLHNLTRLVLRTNGVTDVSELAHLTSLTNLRLEWNEIEDISPLVGMTQLKQLNIKDNHITDISAWADMVELEHLTFRGNPVEDISALAGLFRLSYLSIRDCKIRNVTPLCSMERLDKLYLERNPLDIQAYKNDLFTIVENNPGLSLSYSPNSRASAEVTAILDGSLGGIRLQWSEVPNGPGYTSYYQIARSSGTSSERIPISDWQTETTFVDDTIVMGEDYSYWVQCSVSSTGDQSGDYSSPISGQVIPSLDDCFQVLGVPLTSPVRVPLPMTNQPGFQSLPHPLIHVYSPLSVGVVEPLMNARLKIPMP